MRSCRALLHRCTALLAFAVLACESGTEPTGPPGSVIWRVDGRGWGTPALDASTVYFVGYNHDLTAVDNVTGQQRWRARTMDGGATTNGHSAVVVGDVIAFGDWDIHGFDRRNGIRRWTFHPTDGYAPGFFYLTADGPTIFAGSPSGRVYAIDGATGTARWVSVLADDNNTSVFGPVVAGDRVFVCIKHFVLGQSGELAALDKATGALLWSTPFPQLQPSRIGGCNRGPVVANDLVIGSSLNGTVYALDQLTGTERWRLPPLVLPPSEGGGTPNGDDRPLLSVGGRIIVGSLRGYVLSVDAATGEERWRSTPTRGSIAAPIVADVARIYLSHYGLQFTVLDRETGQVIFVAGDKPEGGGLYFPTPAVDADRIYVGGVDGLFALRK